MYIYIYISYITNDIHRYTHHHHFWFSQLRSIHQTIHDQNKPTVQANWSRKVINISNCSERIYKENRHTSHRKHVEVISHNTPVFVTCFFVVSGFGSSELSAWNVAFSVSPPSLCRRSSDGSGGHNLSAHFLAFFSGGGAASASVCSWLKNLLTAWRTEVTVWNFGEDLKRIAWGSDSIVECLKKTVW